LSKTLGLNGVEKWGKKMAKKFSKISSKKFGGKEKVRIFAVPKRKDGFTGLKLERESSLKILKRQAAKFRRLNFCRA
jgi:hypothetical protein